MVRSSLAGVVGAALLLAAAPAFAAARPPTPELIDRAEHGGRLEHGKADLYRAYAIGAPERLPAAYRSNAPWDGTLTLLHLHRDLPKLRPADREKVQAVLRPPASGPSCSSSSGTQTNTLPTTHFQITYNSVSAGLTAQDYADSLESSWGTEISSFGWAAPPVYTTNPAPGDRYYVRIDNLGSGLYGYVAPSGTYAGPVGDNPSTSWNDVDAYASCMVLNSNYDPSVFPSSAQASLDSTTAHEFNHSIQYGIGGLAGANLPDDVFVEGGATWMEDEAQDSANDNYNYLWPVFADSMGDYDASPYPYWITFRGLTERYGTGVPGGAEQVMQDFWELTSQGPQSNLQAMNAALVHARHHAGRRLPRVRDRRQVQPHVQRRLGLSVLLRGGRRVPGERRPDRRRRNRVERRRERHELRRGQLRAQVDRAAVEREPVRRDAPEHLEWRPAARHGRVRHEHGPGAQHAPGRARRGPGRHAPGIRSERLHVARAGGDQPVSDGSEPDQLDRALVLGEHGHGGAGIAQPVRGQDRNRQRHGDEHAGGHQLRQRLLAGLHRRDVGHVDGHGRPWIELHRLERRLLRHHGLVHRLDER